MVLTNPAPSLEYTELAGTTQVALAAAWTDWDLSAAVPAGAKFVEILLSNNQIQANSLGGRNNGSAVNRVFDFGGVLEKTTLTVPCDTNRIIEVAKTQAGGAAAYLMGYWS